jgi:hypothetical protein
MIATVKKPKQRKILDKLKKLGSPKQLTTKQLNNLYKGFAVKYAMGLEDTVQAQHKQILHLQETIRFLQEKVNDDEYNQSQRTIKFQQKIIEDNKKGIATLVDKYEDELEALQKENTQLTLSFEELKVRHFGKFERRLKEFALRPDKKKDN